MDPKYEAYMKEHDRMQSLHVQNLINQDTAMLQLSAGLVAALATFGKEIILSNKTLAFISVGLLGLTILQIIVGYLLSNSFFTEAKRKLGENYSNGNDLHDNLQNGFGSINDILNVTSVITFVMGMLFFFIMFIVYAGGLK